MGPAGSGKSALIAQLASALGYRDVRTVPLYRDLTTTELLQRRTLDERGNTGWLSSPLVAAALSGGLCVLDGVRSPAPLGPWALGPLVPWTLGTLKPWDPWTPGPPGPLDPPMRGRGGPRGQGRATDGPGVQGSRGPGWPEEGE